MPKEALITPTEIEGLADQLKGNNRLSTEDSIRLARNFFQDLPEARRVEIQIIELTN